MDPAWAYATFDRVRGQKIDGPTESHREELSQIEFEVGPDAAMVRTALALVPRLDGSLGPAAEESRIVYGRKIHRLLAASD